MAMEFGDWLVSPASLPIAMEKSLALDGVIVIVSIDNESNARFGAIKLPAT